MSLVDVYIKELTIVSFRIFKFNSFHTFGAAIMNVRFPRVFFELILGTDNSNPLFHRKP